MKIRLSYIVCIFLGVLVHPVGVMADEYYDQKVSLFEILPVGEQDIVFLGNSITDGGEFAELLGVANVKNRGIRSDSMRGVQKRLDQILRGHPAKLFLLIGINDIAQKGVTVEALKKRYKELVSKIREKSPQTRVYLQSVMPINNTFKRYLTLSGKESMIKALNKEIKQIASEQDCVFIDLTEALADSQGRLRKEYTNDGLHLKGPAYRAWIEVIRPYVEE